MKDRHIRMSIEYGREYTRLVVVVCRCCRGVWCKLLSRGHPAPAARQRASKFRPHVRVLRQLLLAESKSKCGRSWWRWKRKRRDVGGLELGLELQAREVMSVVGVDAGARTLGHHEARRVCAAPRI